MRFSSYWRAGALLLTALTGTLAATASVAAPLQIALLLPQSGRMAKAAETIRDGFLAAYYQDSATLAETPTLRFYDSDAQDVAVLVRQAHANGASIVIGPLDRERVERLIQVGMPPIPVLALNSVEGSVDNLYQFALAPEDEILRLVAWMDQQKVRQPLLLVGTDDAGQRQLKLFQAAWQAGHPGALTIVTLDANRKGGIVASVRDATRQGSRYDAIFLATATLARQVQPTLTYYHSTLPLYSLSSAWDPTADASGQKDLDGLRFCDQPWMLEEARPEQTALYESFTRPASGYDRLYAFGADAWTLVRQWEALRDGESVSLRSGRVRADSTRHLRRIPTCAEVRNGTAAPLWSPEVNDGSRR